MEKLYLDLIPVGAVADAWRRPAGEIMSLTGGNIGNLAFRHALRGVVDGLEAYRTVLYAQALRQAKAGEISDVLVSCANWLGASERLEAANANRARVFEAIDAPVVSFGLGVQAKLDAGLPGLGPHTLRLAKILGERARYLSVRDEITQETLAAAGITNTVVTGCPSNFLNPDPELGAAIAARAASAAAAAPAWQDLRIAISEISHGHRMTGRLIADHLALLRSAPAFYVIQSPELLPFVLGESAEAPRAYLVNNTFEDRAEAARVLRAKALHFSAMDAWLDFSRTCALSLGMRIHGTMVPLQAGVPSLLIAHDSRTAGLAQIMGVPRLSPEAYLAGAKAGLAGLLETIAGAMEGYDARRAELAHTMAGYVTDNGLKPHPRLLALAGMAQPAADAGAEEGSTG